MLVCLPFSPDELDDPPAFEYVVADAARSWPDRANDADVYVPSYRFGRRPRAVIEQMPRLRVVQTLTAGYEHFLPVPAGITLCNAAGVHDASTAELAVALILAAQRDLPEALAGQRRHEWTSQTTRSLADRRVVVLGAGGIGRALQRRLAGFECTVTLVGRRARDDVRGAAELPELLADADVLVVAVPLDDRTRGLVDRSLLARLPDDALVVNVARGQVVVTADLSAELVAGRLRAALDVTDPEPLPPDHPLWTAPGLIISHHRGGATDAMWPRAYRLVADQLRRLADGRPLRNVVVGPGG